MTTLADPKETPTGRVLDAARMLASATEGLVNWAIAPKLLDKEIADYAARPNVEAHPCGDELDSICSAIMALHPAIGRPASTRRLYDAAEAFFRGED